MVPPRVLFLALQWWGAGCAVHERRVRFEAVFDDVSFRPGSMGSRFGFGEYEDVCVPSL